MVDYTTDIEDFMERRRALARSRALLSADASPEDAAQAYSLEQSMGVPSVVAMDDVPRFTNAAKGVTAAALIDSNPHLQDYINSHPMAAKVSNDDLDNLNEASKSMEQLHLRPGVRGEIDAFKEGFNVEGMRDEYSKLYNMIDSPLWRSFVQYSGFGGAGVAFMGGIATLRGMTYALGAMIPSQMRQFGVSTQESERALRDFVVLPQVAIPELAELGINAKWRGVINDAAHFAKTGKPWLDAGVPMPPGFNRATDELWKEESKADRKIVEEIGKNLDKTETLARSPELAKVFAELKLGDEAIEVDAAKLRATLGDKVADFPGLEEQLAVKEPLGGKVTMPLTEWLTEVDPEIRKALKDDVSIREGLTKNEADELPEPKTLGNDPVDNYKAVNGMEPVAGDTVRLVRTDLRPDPDVPVHNFDIQDKDGNPIAKIQVAEENKGQRLYIDNFEAIAGKLTVGTRGVLQAMHQLWEAFPLAKEIQGDFVGGVREGTAREGERVTFKRPRSKEAIEAQAKLVEEASKPTGPELEHPPEEPELARPSAFGMTKERFERYQKSMDEEFEAQAKKAAERVTRIERRKLSDEWKAGKAEMRPEVVEAVKKRPEILAWEYFTHGTLDGEKVAGMPKLIAKDVPADLRPVLRKFMGKEGVDPDAIATKFGFSSGDELVNRLAQLEAARLENKLGPTEYVRRMIDAELERRMEAKHGKFDENLLREVKDQVYSDVTLRRLHEETIFLAELAKAQRPLTFEQMKQGMAVKLGEAKLRDVKTSSFERDIRRIGNKLEDALLKDKVTEAFRQSQLKEQAFMHVREAREIEEMREDFDRIAKRWSKRDIENFPPLFTNGIHEILQKFDLTTGRTAEDLRLEWEGHGFPGGLRRFVEKRNQQGKVDGTILPVADWILDSPGKLKLDNLTVNEFRDVKQALDVLEHQGREENKIDTRKGKELKAEWMAAAEEQLAEKFPETIKYPPAPHGRIYEAKAATREFIAALQNLETFFFRLDGRKYDGQFMQTFVYPGAEAANYKARLNREFAQFYKGFDKLERGRKSFTHPFVDPKTGEPWVGLTRTHLEGIIANIGNEGNLKALENTLGVSRETIFKVIENNTTVEDLDRAQERGKIFTQAWELYREMKRNKDGFAPKSIEYRPFEMHGKQYDGWYYPIVDDRDRSPHQAPNPEDAPTNFWPAPATGFAKPRIPGAEHVLDFDINLAPVKLNQMLHAIAFEPFVSNAAKLIRDDRFRNSIGNHYGKEYVGEMDAWLADIAGNASFDDAVTQRAARIANYIRQNIISTYIAFNPYTIQKHGLSAFAMSAKEVGFLRFLKTSTTVGADLFYHAVTDLFSKDPYLGNTWWKFIWDNSEEIQRRDRNWQETVMGQHDIVYGKTSLRNSIAKWGAKGVAISDMISAAPMWLAAYRKFFDEYGTHGAAVDAANYAVRRAHGSTAITALPRMVRRAGTLGSFMTSVYGFMGTIMNRRIEIMHDLNDTFKLGRQGEIAEAAKKLPGITTSLFTYVVWPAFVTWMVTREFTDDKRSYLAQALTALGGGLAESVLYLRDISYALEHDVEPTAGLLGGMLHDPYKVYRDLKKQRPFGKDHAGKLVQDTLTAFGGEMWGRMPKPIAGAIRFQMDKQSGQQRPKTFGDQFRGYTRGDMRVRTEK